MSLPRHPKRPPQIEPLLAVLAAHDVRYILTGSVAALLHGVDLQPGDLDITPALDRRNLTRLAAVLVEIEATPEDFGRWQTTAEGERRWIPEPYSPEKLAAWRPDVGDLKTLDHLFYTRFGDFDIVPRLAGAYVDLQKKAVKLAAFGQQVWVAHVDDLLACLTVPRREKDRLRVEKLRQIQQRL